MTVADHGVGVDRAKLKETAQTDAPHWGLFNMQQRAEGTGGKLHIDSEPGRGTRITADYLLSTA